MVSVQMLPLVPDELISTVGIDAFQQVVDTAVNAGQYLADVVIKPRLQQYDLDTITPKERDNMFTYCQSMGDLLSHPRDLHDYIASMSEVLPAMAYVQLGTDGTSTGIAIA